MWELIESIVATFQLDGKHLADELSSDEHTVKARGYLTTTW